VLRVNMVPEARFLSTSRPRRRLENKSKFKMMTPVTTSSTGAGDAAQMAPAGAAGMLGIGIGGTPSIACCSPRRRLWTRSTWPVEGAGPQNDIEALRIEIFDKVNALGIGAQGWAGFRPSSTSDQGLALPCAGNRSP